MGWVRKRKNALGKAGGRGGRGAGGLDKRQRTQVVRELGGSWKKPLRQQDGKPMPRCNGNASCVWVFGGDLDPISTWSKTRRNCCGSKNLARANALSGVGLVLFPRHDEQRDICGLVV